MPQELRHAGEGPAATVGVTDKRPLTLGKKSHTHGYHRDLRRRRAGPGVPGSLPVWLLRWIFRRQALSYCLLHPGKEQEKSSCSRKWARLWENRALTVMNVFSQPEQRNTEPAHWRDGRHVTELTQSPPRAPLAPGKTGGGHEGLPGG